jgi:hypothetical protein
MKKAIEHKVQAQIKSESPEILLEVIYQDDFTNDHYILKGSGLTDKGTKSINFNISKNGKNLQSLEMKERDVNSFLNEFLKLTKDDDFNKEFKSHIYETSSKQINDFFGFYDTSIVFKGITLEGEVKRMQKMAGIIKG